jgi:hypothetical protein
MILVVRPPSLTLIYEDANNQQSTEVKAKIKDKDPNDYSLQIHQSMKNNINTQIQINNIIFNNHSTNNSNNNSNKVDIHLLMVCPLIFMTSKKLINRV